jgi:hypothetical protein
VPRFEELKRHVAKGYDTTVSQWGKQKLDANPDMWKEWEVGQGLEWEKLFWRPIAVEVDDQGQIFVVEFARNRIQVYRKQAPIFLGLYDGASFVSDRLSLEVESCGPCIFQA